MVSGHLFELNQDGAVTVLSSYLRDKGEIRSMRIVDAVDGSQFLGYHREGDVTAFGGDVEPHCLPSEQGYQENIVVDGSLIGTVQICVAAREGEIELSAAEVAWIEKNPVISVHNELDWKPYNFYEDGRAQGLSVDLMDLLARKVGLTVHYERGSWSDLLNMAMNHKLDVMLNTGRNSEREEFLLFAGPYAENPNAIFGRRSDPSITTIEDLNGRKVAVVEGFFQENNLRQHHPLVQRVVVSNSLEALKAVAFGRVDATIGSRIVLNFLIQQEMLSEVEAKGEFAINGEGDPSLYLAVRNNAPVLHSILSKALESVTESEMNAIRKRWMEIETEGLGVRLPLTPELQQWIERHPVIRVGGEMDWAPFDFVNRSGDYDGIAKDYLDEIAALTGLRFEMVTGQTWSELLASFQRGELDLLPALNYNEERAQFSHFTQPYITLADYFFVRKGHPGFRSLSALDGMRVAVVKGYAVGSWLKKKYPKIELVEVETILEGLRLLANGGCVTFINDNPSTTYVMQQFFISGVEMKQLVPGRTTQDIHMAAKKGYQPLAEIVSLAMTSLSREKQRAITERWMSQVESSDVMLSLSEKERDWLRQNAKIRFAVDPAWLPIEAINRDHEVPRYEGMMADLLQQISETSGIDFQLVATEKWTDSVELAKRGEIDMLAAVSRTAEREGYLDFSEPTIELNDGILMRSDAGFITDVGDLVGMRVGVPEGTSVQSMLERDYPELILVPIRGTRAGLEQLSSGGVEAYVGNLEVIGYLINQLGFYNLKVVLRLDQRRQLHIALRKGLPPEVLSILNRAITALPEHEIEAIRLRWVGLKVSDGVDYQLLWKIALAIIVIFILFTLNNLRLKRMVQARTEDIERQKEELRQFNRNLEMMVEERTAALATSEKRIRTVMDNMSDALISINPYGIIESANRAAETIFGYPLTEIVGKNIKRLMPPSEAMHHDRHMARFTRSREGEFVGQGARERIGLHANGHEIPLEVAVGEVDIGDERIYVGVLRDITERKEAEYRLHDAYEVITGSIQYASRIQRSILPREELVNQLLPKSFILWQPRDVVGGDTYWVRSRTEGIYLILGDCTGHGVPGAFMTLIANGAFEYALDLVTDGDCAALIGHMHRSMQSSLGQDGRGSDSDDGIELGVVWIPNAEHSLTYAGARFSLFYHDINGDDVVEVKGDKKGIAYSAVAHDTLFSNRTVERRAGRRFFLSSDGMIDQVGGEKRRMMGKKRFKQLLLEGRALPLEEVGDHMMAAMNRYMGSEKRRDDVSIIGFEP
ncbi:MAG: transporter substrate-binding domain-containing protein [Gammaproteobacteria bacterium]|nr:transporter substrate-binding domain-containing protein [Gammaproteobacteria bacterium]